MQNVLLRLGGLHRHMQQGRGCKALRYDYYVQAQDQALLEENKMGLPVGT